MGVPGCLGGTGGGVGSVLGELISDVLPMSCGSFRGSIHSISYLRRDDLCSLVPNGCVLLVEFGEKLSDLLTERVGERTSDDVRVGPKSISS